MSDGTNIKGRAKGDHRARSLGSSASTTSVSPSIRTSKRTGQLLATPDELPGPDGSVRPTSAHGRHGRRGPRLDSELEDLYRLLTVEIVSSETGTEVWAFPERTSVDVERLADDLVPYQTTRLYLTNDREATDDAIVRVEPVRGSQCLYVRT
jgi:hypothetical protein